MTLNQLASKIAKIEGKKSQARIGDIREVLSILADMIYKSAVIDPMDESEYVALFSAGKKRAKRKANGKKK